MKQLVLLIMSSTPSLKIYSTNFKPLFLAKFTYFHNFPYVYLSLIFGGW